MGWERELKGKAAGLLPLGDLTRVIRGVAAGIGFVGAGAILKMTDQGQIMGLTTAAGIWMTAAIGVAVGTGRVWLPVLGVAIAVLIMALLGYYRIPASRE